MRTPEKFVMSSVRNPCDAYVSLWAFQSDPAIHHGLMADLKAKKPDDWERTVGRDMRGGFQSADDVRRFRAWVKYLAHPTENLGLLSGRFYMKYFGDNPSYNMKSNALLAKSLSAETAVSMSKTLAEMDVRSIVDCWVHTENTSSELKACLDEFKAAQGPVKMEDFQKGVEWASGHMKKMG